MQCESKSSPLKLFALFSLMLSIFERNLPNLLSIDINIYVNFFCRFVLVVIKMALIFTYRFCHFYRAAWNADAV